MDKNLEDLAELKKNVQDLTLEMHALKQELQSKAAKEELDATKLSLD